MATTSTMQPSQELSLPRLKKEPSSLKAANKSNAGAATQRPQIPVVPHLIRNEDIELSEGAVLEQMDLDRVIRLFVEKHTMNSKDRHFHSIKKIARTYFLGFPLKDVVRIVKLFNLLADKAETSDEYIPCISTLLGLFQYPFFKERSSDELAHESDIVECLANLGYLFRIPNSTIRSNICACIYNLITFKVVPESYANMQRCSKAFIQKTIQLSDLPETLVKSLTLMEENLDIRKRMMRILQILSKNETNCKQMLSADCASRLVLKINQPVPNDEILFRTVEILWNLLECGERKKVAEQLNSLVAINQIRDAFFQQLLQGFSNYDRQLRNDILIIAIQLAQTMPKLPFIETGFAKDLLLFATYPEIKSHSPLIKNLKLTTCYEDFELKKLFINFAVTLASNRTSYQLLSESCILLSLFSFVKPFEANRDVRDWTISQFEELQLHAMSALCILIPILLKDYFECRGSNIVLQFLEWCTNDKNDYAGYGNSFHGKGGRGTKRAQLKYCLRVLRSVVSTNNEQAIQDLTDQGALALLIGILKRLLQHEETKKSNDQLDVEIQSDMLFILSCICENDLHRKELFGNEGIEILIDLLRKKPESVWNGLGYQRLVIGTIDAIWATVVGCSFNEDYFIQKEGIFHLLDILEVSAKSMQNLILGCLLDLCENSKTLTHLMQWESRKNQKIANFLCSLWREEERDIGAERDEHGIIADPANPLGGAGVDGEEFIKPLPASVPSRSIVEVSENMRAKIYGIFCRLGFNELSGITQEDQMTLCIIENYLDFKLGEVFKEINRELQVDNVKPIAPDQEALENILKAANERAWAVNINQKQMYNTHKQQELLQEKEFYYELRQNFASKEKRIEEWNDYVNRVSKYPYLLHSKEKQMTAIEDSRPPEREPAGAVYQTIHNLEIPNLAVTSFSGRYIAIDSTPAEITGGRLGKLLKSQTLNA